MIMTKRRARRIAADEAHAWARNLRLGNHHAKSVLRSLTLYVDGDGYCFVGIDQLADDCELSADTVRRRLVWLEEIGAISRVPQWIDAKGVRNSDERGKRTTDLIRLLFEADQDAIEALARGENVPETPAKSTPFSPSSQQGLNVGEGSVSPAPALRQPSHSGEGLISEPEPEPDSPNPQGGEREGAALSEDDPEFRAAWSSWPGHEVMRRDLALDEWAELTVEQRRHCRAAIPLFVAMQDRLGRKHPPNFHLWIRNRGFEEFPTAAAGQENPQPSRYELASAEGRAIKALYDFAGALLFEHGGAVRYPLPLTAQVMAFADLPPGPSWQWIEASNQIAAWNSFLSAHVHLTRRSLVRPQLVKGETRVGMFAPWAWPPRKDGSISNGEGPAA